MFLKVFGGDWRQPMVHSQIPLRHQLQLWRPLCIRSAQYRPTGGSVQYNHFDAAGFIGSLVSKFDSVVFVYILRLSWLSVCGSSTYGICFSEWQKYLASFIMYPDCLSTFYFWLLYHRKAFRLFHTIKKNCLRKQRTRMCCFLFK